MGFSSPTPAVLTYLVETNLYVNSGSGNDSGDGTISDPLQSLEQALKNVYARRVTGNNAACSIFLSGAVGDSDVISKIVYYWPNKYQQSMGNLTLWNWDGADTSTTAPAPAMLYTGSAVVYSNSYTTDMTVYDGGCLTTLFTDSGFSTPVDYGVAGSMGPLSEGWLISDTSAVTSLWSGFRPIAHVVPGGNDNVVRIASPRDDDDFSLDDWTTAGRGDMAIIKWGASIDFTLVAADGNASKQQSGVYKQNWYNLEVTCSNPTSDEFGFGSMAGRSAFINCIMKLDMASQHAGYGSWQNCYWAPNDQLGPGNFGGNVDWNGGVLDMGKTADPTRHFLRINGLWRTAGYSIFQNISSSTRGLMFGPDARIVGMGDQDNVVWHLSGCAGFYTEGAPMGGSVRTSGTPIRLIGELLGDQAGGVYSLRLNSGSMWMYHTGSIVMQEGGTTEALVSVSNGEARGAADIFSACYAVNYTSSINRNISDAADYATYATDYSSSLAALQSAAD